MDPQNPPPPEPVRSQGPSCWAIGGVSCLVLIVVGMIALFVGVRSFMSSKEGKEVAGQMTSMMSGVKEAVACDVKLRQVYGAITRYRAKNGAYPKDIKSLVPMYLPEESSCHCGLDPNPDPAHLTFEYRPPTEASASTDPVLAFTWNEKITLQGKSMVSSVKYYFTLAGKEMIQRSTIDPDGKVTTLPAQEQTGATPL